MPTTNRQQMLNNVRHFWIDGVLDNSLHNAVLMQLGLYAQPEKVHHPWDVKLRHNSQDQPLSQDNRISDVFDDSAGSLLILGEPGSGKTTLLLDLTRDLLDRADAQTTYPIPIVFNLASWANDKLPLDMWLVEELNVKYQVAQAVAEQWVADNALLLLLDGLDEVAESHRDDCVNQINSYHTHNPDVLMVVCSRTNDYDTLSHQLNFHNAVMINPLDDEQVDTYLANFGDKMNGLRQQMVSDRRLRALAETPLTLSIMTLAYQGVDTSTLPDDVSMDVQRKHLFETYINTMFERYGKSEAHQPKETRQYLSWLAGRMVERRQTLFHIENLQWDWLETRLQQSLYKLFNRVTYGTVIGGISGALATVVMMLLIAVLLGQDITVYQSTYGTIYGLRAVVIIATLGMLGGMLAGGIPFGLTGLIAFTGERLSIKGQARSYRTRTALTSIGIGVISGAIGGLVLALLLVINSGGSVTTHARHFYEIGMSDRFMEGLEAVWWHIQIGMLMGLVGGIASVGLAGWWHRREGRVRQVINGVYGLIIGFGFMLSYWFLYETNSSYAIDFGDLLFPILIISLFTGGIGVLAGGLKDRIESAESIGWRWSWRWAKVGLAVALVIVGLDYLSIQTWGYPPDDFVNRAISIFIPVGTVCVLVGGVAAGLRKNETVESRTKPNHGIRRSAKSAIKITGAFAIVGVIIGLIAMVSIYGAEFINNGFQLINLTDWDIQNMVEQFRGASIVGVSAGLVAGLILGGTDTVIKHIVLRLMLWVNGDIPMNYAKLLDYASSLILMRKVGGGYIFVHRYLLEHFAVVEAD